MNNPNPLSKFEALQRAQWALQIAHETSTRPQIEIVKEKVDEAEEEYLSEQIRQDNLVKNLKQAIRDLRAKYIANEGTGSEFVKMMSSAYKGEELHTLWEKAGQFLK